MRSTNFFHFSLSIIVVGLLLWSCSDSPNISIKKKKIEPKDSVQVWLSQSKSRKLKIEDRRNVLGKAYEEASLEKSDVKRLKYYSDISYQAEVLNNDSIFKIANKSNLNLAKKLQDTLKMGDAYWNYGAFYQKKEIIDSAYFHFHKAYQQFKAVNHKLYTANMVYNMGYIQGKIKDYTGSEISIVEAIELFKELDRPLNLYRCYNYLGLIYMELEEFNRSIFYHNEALDYLKLVKNPEYYKGYSLNNLGLVYRKKKDFKESIKYFELAQTSKVLRGAKNNFYAALVDNKAYSKFLYNDTLRVQKDLNLALRIRDSISNIAGVVISKRHISEFNAFKGDTVVAVKNAKAAYNLAEQVDNNRDKLETLMLLSKIDKINAKEYLAEYVHLNDSLQTAERKTRNKFTRIRFETDEYIEETEKLNQQRIITIVISVFVLFVLAFAYIVRGQRIRNKELRFESEQQEANAEIVSLMIKQQGKLEEGRMKERQRISADLHDGVLGKIFGTRMGLGFLNIQGDDDTLEKHKTYVDELQNIEKEIRTISHELKNEILSSKEDFYKILENLIVQKSELGNFEYDFIYDKELNWDRLSDDLKVNFYRITQEGLQNIIKYAEASLVKIEVYAENGNVILRIADDGKGFKTTTKRKGIGLRNMEDRAAKLNGFVRINSVENKGTTVFVSCPIQHKDYE